MHYITVGSLLLSDTNVASNSQVCASTILLLQIIENLKIRSCNGLKWRDIHIKFHENRSFNSVVGSGRHTHSIFTSESLLFSLVRKVG